MISTRQLAYRYAGGPEIRFDDIDVEQGGVLLLQGASGSGKSTWLALAAGLLCPGEGHMTVAGQSIKALLQATTNWEGATLVIATHHARMAAFFAENSDKKTCSAYTSGTKSAETIGVSSAATQAGKPESTQTE